MSWMSQKAILAAALLCALGGGLPLPVRNALMYFEEELKNCLEDR